MTISNRKYVALVVASIASATVQTAFAESGRSSEPMARAVVADACMPTAPAQAQGAYYTYLRVVDGMTRDAALQAARHVDKPVAERTRATTRDISPGVASAAGGAPAVLR